MQEFEGLKVPHNIFHCTERIYKCDTTCEQCIFKKGNEIKLAKYILSHKTPITENILPFGMLSEEKRNELQKSEVVDNGRSNIQILSVLKKNDKESNIVATNCLDNGACFNFDSIYRLDPTYKPKKMRPMTLSEIWVKRKEWEFKAPETTIRVKVKVVNDNEQIKSIWGEHGYSIYEEHIELLKYRPIGSSEAFKPLPEMECEG